MSYEKDKFDSYLTSASLSGALAAYVTSTSLAAAIALLVSSNSQSAAIATDALTVRGPAAVSATASVGALTVAGTAWGRPGLEYLGTNATAGAAAALKVSGSWANYEALTIDYRGQGAATTTNLILFLYTDGGTTPFMTYQFAANTSATAAAAIARFDVLGSNNANVKYAVPRTMYFRGIATQAAQTFSATVTTGAINCIGVCTAAGATTTTQSAASVYVYGWRT